MIYLLIHLEDDHITAKSMSVKIQQMNICKEENEDTAIYISKSLNQTE